MIDFDVLLLSVFLDLLWLCVSVSVSDVVYDLETTNALVLILKELQRCGVFKGMSALRPIELCWLPCFGSC